MCVCFFVFFQGVFKCLFLFYFFNDRLFILCVLMVFVSSCFLNFDFDFSVFQIFVPPSPRFWIVLFLMRH